MPITKEFGARTADIQCLEGILKERSLSAHTKNNVRMTLSNLRQGDEAEQHAGYLLKGLFQDRKNSCLINGLRLDIDDNIAQIDHISINAYGVVYLFETKSFSTGLKIDDDGIFWRMRHADDEHENRYQEIPSPIEQSKRHERALNHAFKRIGYTPSLIKHIVIIDYKAELEKPSSGFDHICRPDKIEAAMDKSFNQDLGMLTTIKLVGKAVTGRNYSTQQIQDLAQQLATLHTPINFNYRAKFGVKASVASIKKKVDATKNYDKLTIPNLAKALGFTSDELEKVLIEYGYLEQRKKGVYLSKKGKDNGLEVRKGRHASFFFLIPKEFESLFNATN